MNTECNEAWMAENVYNQSVRGPCKAILDRTPLLEINTRTLHKHNHRRARGVIKRQMLKSGETCFGHPIVRETIARP